MTMDIGSLISAGVDDISGNVYDSISLYADTNIQKQGLGLQKEGLALEREKFDLAKLLEMQDYRETKRQQKWKADFMRYLSQGYDGGGA